ncbi:MAG TPA: hypothetical protein VIG29_21585, partial [Vicinamibacteria bacterium]
PAPPRTIPASLHHTLAVDPPPLPATPAPAVTRPDVAPAAKQPAASPLHHTQLYLDAPGAGSTPPQKSTGEMMEAILDGSGDAHAVSYEVEKPRAAAVPKAPEARSDNSTQFFPGSSALPPLPPQVPSPSEEDYFEGSPGFASLSLDYESPPVPSEPEMPLIEATVVEETPEAPGPATTRPSMPRNPDGASGLEFFAMNESFQVAEEAASPPATLAETSVAASLPTRPRTEELDLDIGNFLNGKEDK